MQEWLQVIEGRNLALCLGDRRARGELRIGILYPDTDCSCRIHRSSPMESECQGCGKRLFGGALPTGELANARENEVVS